MHDKTFLEGVWLIQTVTQKKFTEDQFKVYKMLLNDITDEDFITGINKLLRERIYTNIPSPAEIREYCLGLKEHDILVKTEEAKQKFKTAISSYGSYCNVAFDDPIIHLVIQAMGGWQKALKMGIEEFNDYMKWEFPKLYKAYSVRKSSIPLFFKGITFSSTDNSVKIIGDIEKAKRWQKLYIEKNFNNLSLEEIEKAKILNLTNIELVENKREKTVNEMILELRAI